MNDKHKKKLYLRTTYNFFNQGLTTPKSNRLKNYSNMCLSNYFENNLPLLNSTNIKLNNEKFVRKIKKAKTRFYKSQEKLSKIIKEEELIKNIYINAIKNKLKDEDKIFHKFLFNQNSINDIINEIPSNQNISNDLIREKEEENKKKHNLRYQNRLEKEINNVYRPERNLGKDENDCNDYIKRFKKLFPNEAIDEIDLKLKTESVILIQRYYREHKDKIKLYIGFEEPHYYIRIYINEYDDYPFIKSIEIKIYSTLFKKNITFIKSIEELLGVSSMNKKNFLKNIDNVLEKIIGTPGGRKADNEKYKKDYYNETKADLSSDDFNDFESD